MKTRLGACACVAYFAATSIASAAPVSILGDIGDGPVEANGIVDPTPYTTLRVGTGGDDERGHAAVFFFPLPVVQSPSSLVAADLQFAFVGLTPFTFPVLPNYNADLYGIGARSTASVMATDYYDGDPSLSSDHVIQAALLVTSSSTGILHTDPAADVDLLGFLQSLYNPDGTPVDAFAVFRINPSIDIFPFQNPLSGYEIASADNTDAGGTLTPQLNLDIVPEPTGLALGALAFLVFGLDLFRRRLLSKRSLPVSVNEP